MVNRIIHDMSSYIVNKQLCCQFYGGLKSGRARKMGLCRLHDTELRRWAFRLPLTTNDTWRWPSGTRLWRVTASTREALPGPPANAALRLRHAHEALQGWPGSTQSNSPAVPGAANVLHLRTTHLLSQNPGDRKRVLTLKDPCRKGARAETCREQRTDTQGKGTPMCTESGGHV